MRSRQLNFAFADSPRGGKGVRLSDVSEGKAYLLRQAECRTTRGRVAASNNRDELLEAVAWLPNLAVALLNVVRNKGSPGVDGQSVDAVVHEARRLAPTLHRMRLKLNTDKSAVRKPEDTHFLGFCFRKSGTQSRIVHASQRTKRRLAEKIRELTPRTFGQSLLTCMQEANRYLRGWISAYWILTGEESRRLLNSADAHIRRRIRVIVLRQKKRARHLFSYLVRHGARREQAKKTAYSRRGIWYRSHTRAIEHVHSPAWFAQRLVSLEAEWRRLHRPPALASGQPLLF